MFYLYGMVTLPSIEKMVYNRIPFLVDNPANNTLIDEFYAEIFAELYDTFGIDEDDMMDETKYSPIQQSLSADMVAISLLKRKFLLNAEGDGTASGISNKILVKAKAGEAEAEWDILKKGDAINLVMAAGDIVKNLMADAGRKANNMGFSLDMRIDGQWVLDVLSWPEGQNILNVPYCP